jgi:hypothetical protein
MKSLFRKITILGLCFPLSYGFTKSTFKCSKFTLKKNQIEKPKSCDDNIVWEYDFKGRSLETVATENVTTNSNMGGAIFHFPGGPKKVFRSTYMSELGNRKGDKRKCLSNLVKAHNLTDIINFYDGHFSNKDALMKSEREMFLGKKGVGGKHYAHLKGYEYRLNYDNFEGDPLIKSIDVFKNVKKVISSISKAKGSVLIHCFGGMHRTGIVYAVMQKCLNYKQKKISKEILLENQCHVKYDGPEKKGGFQQENIKLIQEFPCNALNSLNNTNTLLPNKNSKETYKANW